MKRWLCIWLLAFVPWLAAQSAQSTVPDPQTTSTGLMTDVQWLSDPAGALTLQEVQALDLQQWRPIQLPLVRGYTSEVTWVRLTLQPVEASFMDKRQSHAAPLQPEDLSNPWVLRIRPPYLDHLTVFDPLQAAPIVVGDYHPKVNTTYQSLNHNVLLPSSNNPRHIYLRLQTTSTSILDLEVMQLSDLMKADRWQDMFFSIYLALLVVFVLWGFVQWLSSHDRLFAWFTLYELSLLLWTLSVLGYVPLFLPNGWPSHWASHALSVSAIAVVAISNVFHLKLTRTFHPPVWLWRLATLGLAFPLIAAVFWINGNTLNAMEINVLGVLASPILFFVLSIAAWMKQRPTSSHALSAVHFVWVYGIIAALMLVYALGLMGLKANANMALYGALTHAGLVGLVVLVTMQVRANRMARLAKQTQRQLERQEVLLEAERQQRREQESLLAMLAHEMKTPMATVKMLLQPSTPYQDDIKAAIDDMNNVIDRCVMTAKLTDQKIKVDLQTFAIDHMVQSLAARLGLSHRLHWQAQGGVDVKGDPQLMHFVLNNLLENAKKYSAEGSVIAVQLFNPFQAQHQSAHHALISAQPTWCLRISNPPGAAGWPSAAHVFDKYYRAPKSHHQAGSGLGLYIVQNLVGLMGGVVRYVPTAVDVVFEVEFPA